MKIHRHARRFLSAGALTALALLLTGSAAQGADYYVAADGNDGWSGRLEQPNPAGNDGPFATLARARDEIRKVKTAGEPKGPVTVFVRGGAFALAQTFALEAQDSGTPDAPVTYRAYQGEKPVLLGGKRITGFVPHQGKILKADVASQGFKNVDFRQLFCNGKRRPLARYPNFDPENPYGGGWAYADGKPAPMYADVPGEDKVTLQYKTEDARPWAKPQEGEVFVFPRYNWWNNIVRIKSIDPQKRTITLAGECSYPIRPTDRYYVQGMFEELDAPGEWYLDRAAGTLYFWPPDDADLATMNVYAPTLRTVVQLTGVSHVTFRGFTVGCCSGTAVVLSNTSGCLVAGNTIRGVGDYGGSGVAVNGGSKNGVVGNDIDDVGRDGIFISGGDRITLTPAENYADNNYIHHTGVYYKQGAGVILNGCGNRASHNLIHDGPRWGIGFAGNNLLIEYNHIRHVNLETADTGAVYTGGRDWLGSRGTVIRHNYFHDILGYGQEHGRWVSPHYAWGVYLDDNTGGVDVVGNIVARAVRGLIHLHNGRDTLVDNNIFVDGTLQQMECNGWTKDHSYWTSHLPTMIQGYESVKDQPAWKKMRNMHIHPNQAVLPDGKIMSGNQFFRNIIYFRDPTAKYVSFRTFPFDQNECDHNLIWHFGKPILTGQTMAGRDLSGNLAPNPGFEQAGPSGLPQDWQWQIRPTATAAARLVDTAAAGRHALQIDAAFVKEKPRDNYPILVSKELELPLGHSYRLSAKMKAARPDAAANLMLQSYVANAYFWASSPNQVKVGAQWQDYEFTFRIPAPGEKGHHEKMKTFRLRVDFRDETGSLLVDDVSLKEVESLDEWASWQAMGMDRHSVIADPLFVDPAHDDYRLRPESPAFKLGFQPIPVEKIGPYQDEWRATWPIVEAEGARERPLVSQPAAK
ncbi:MAG: right-handed parallel beta-helix repeat-containing protein [Pirellulales bacterium]|nr:right-handed parallel beta-helix repeat-containing protein [Pirellulales bacterium]